MIIVSIGMIGVSCLLLVGDIHLQVGSSMSCVHIPRLMRYPVILSVVTLRRRMIICLMLLEYWLLLSKVLSRQHLGLTLLRQIGPQVTLQSQLTATGE